MAVILVHALLGAVLLAGVQADTSGYCNALSPQARDFCRKVVKDKTLVDSYCNAGAWASKDISTYWCSGITRACTIAEVSRHDGNMARCVQPLPDGATCGARSQAGFHPTCRSGVCKFPNGTTVQRLSLPAKPVYAKPTVGGNTVVTIIPPKPTPPTASTPHSGAFVAQLDVTPGTTIPIGFLGTSHEWGRIGDYGRNPTAWKNIFKTLGPNNIMRIGGASQDLITKMPDKSEWEAMAQLNKAIGTRFIIGLPLYGNRPDFTTSFMATAKQYLGNAIVGFELGNEPQFWKCPGLGGWYPGGNWLPGYNPYADYFHRMAGKISGCDNPKTAAKASQKPELLGPGWDNLNTISGGQVAAMLQRGKCYMNGAAVHYYPYYSQGVMTPSLLLSEDLMREAVRNITKILTVTKALGGAGNNLRITEANSISGGGVGGASDMFAAALWTADLAFEFAKAGAASMHLHWGDGGRPATKDAPMSSPTYVGVRTYFAANGTTGPRPRVPWFGYVLFQRAVQPAAAGEPTSAQSGPAKFLSVKAAASSQVCLGKIKVWPVVLPGGEIRVVVLNKGDDADCEVTVQLPGAYGVAAVTRLTSSKKLLMSTEGVKFGGQMYVPGPDGYSNGLLSGAKQVEYVTPVYGPNLKGDHGANAYTFVLARATAALMAVAKAGESMRLQSAEPYYS